MAEIGPMWPWNDAERTEFREEFRPTVAELVAMLRSDEELPSDFRQWFADLLDPDGGTPVRLVPRPRKPGPPPQTAKRRRMEEAARCVMDLEARGVKQEAALAEVGKDFGCSRGHLKRALAEVREWDRIVDEVRRQTEAEEEDVFGSHSDPEWDAYVAEGMRRERAGKP